MWFAKLLDSFPIVPSGTANGITAVAPEAMATEPGRLDRRASEGLPRLSVKCLKWKCAVTTLIFNARLDAVVCGVFLVLVMAILVDSMRVWIGILRGTHEAHVCEAPFVLSQLRAEEL